MNIAITGSTGLIGSALESSLTTSGHQVVRMVRTPVRSAAKEICWDPSAGKINTAALEGIDAVVHLAGKSIAGGRWTPQKKRRIRESRIKGTSLLAESLARLSKPPKVLICASAIGYYGDRGQEILTEESRSGTGFLPDVCREWENAAGPAAEKGIRVVITRIGMVLSAAGGALATMLPAFRLGLGGRIGSGNQYMSWIAIDELVDIIRHAIQTESLHGPINAVAPRPVTNLEFSKALGHLLSRPTILFLPSFAARFLLGEMADELLLASTRVVPARLEASGYKFRFSLLEDALRHVLGKPTSRAARW